jgi:hypothetical protein
MSALHILAAEKLPRVRNTAKPLPANNGEV